MTRYDEHGQNEFVRATLGGVIIVSRDGSVYMVIYLGDM